MCGCNIYLLNISVETLILHTLTEGFIMKTLSEKMLSILERLAEMFPKQDYQSELERYISSKFPKNAVDVEHLTKEFEQRSLGKVI